MTTQTGQQSTAGVTQTTGMLLDRFAPQFDYSLIEHIVVNASPEAAFHASRHLDMLTVDSWVAKAAAKLASMRNRITNRAPRRKPTRLTLDDIAEMGSWVLLEEASNREYVFGAVGRFGKPVVQWERIRQEEFTTFAKPGSIKIAASISVRPYGANSSLLSYEARVRVDDEARKKFGWYWMAIAPLAKSSMRAELRAAKRNAERAQR
jgi:hypothetical protein